MPTPRSHVPRDRGRRDLDRQRPQAVRNGVSRAGETVRNLDWFEVTEIRGWINDGEVGHFQVTMKIGFRLDDEMPATIDLTGAADLHCHFGPDAHRERSVDALRRGTRMPPPPVTPPSS